MKTTCIIFLLGFFGLVLGQTQDDILLKTNPPNSVNYALDGHDGYCQACLGFNLASADRGRFRMLFEESGNECCAAGETNCPSGTGCNWHAVKTFPILFNITNTSTTARINGTIKSSRSPGCTIYAGSVCATFDWYYELVNETTNLTLNGYTFPLYKNMLLIRFTMSTWVFSAGSQGIRLKISWGTESVTCEHWYMNPGNVEVDDENLDIFESNYSSCRAKDYYDQTGELFLTPYGFLDSYTDNPMPVTVKGPRDYSEPDARMFTIDFPVFSGSMTYYMAAAIPKASGFGRAGRLTASMATTLGLVVLPFIL